MVCIITRCPIEGEDELTRVASVKEMDLKQILT